ncbi:AraC family transcriptional regulator [Butyricicoccus sp. Marseille-Q5471]|uniref:AraC family transcriptional regulator n=1 Tax=Butyricicoccus sp. Marseille-Q5471 TaxID=3039493 RepID=UPI0024BD039F|nr:AraC family transcriptional regulator [Butyricicoccus sp. Marseille-Q5471]
MLCQNETGVLSGSELFFSTVGAATRRLFYYVNSCGHYYCERGYKIRRKHMDNLLLMLIEKGEMRVEYRGQKYIAQAGDIVLMDCTFPQYYDTADYVEFYWMHIAGVNSFELCEHLTRAHGSIVHHTDHNDKAATLIRFMVSQFANNQPVSDAEHSRTLHSVLCYLMPGAQVTTAGEENGPIQQAVKFIHNHLGEDLNLRRVAAEVHLSPSHLIRLFRAELHHSPHEYIVLMRMDRAKYLLKTTSMPIKAISAEVGYRTESSFTGAFTEKIGISPRRFRELPLG